MINLYTRNNNINLIIKTAGNSCNINCTYCFEQGKDVVHNSITRSTLKKILDKIDPSCTIVFHGGEPLIVGKEKFIELLNVVREYYPRKIIAVRIQTNGTLIDEEWLELLYSDYSDLDIEIAISLDGTEQMNRLRVDYFGKSTFSNVRRAFELLEKKGQKAGMLSVISKGSLGFYKEYIDFIASIPNVSFVKINALFNVENGFLSAESISPQEYASFIINSGLYYIKTGLYRKVAIEPLLSILQRLNNKESKYCNYSCRKCYNHISLYPDGSLGPCDCFSVNDFYITNINEIGEGKLEEYIEKNIDSKNGNILNEIISECKNCDIKDFCNGGCISQRYYFLSNEKLRKEYCEAKHRLYDCFGKFVFTDRGI